MIFGSNPEYREIPQKHDSSWWRFGIAGLGAMIERRLSDLGDVNVHVVDDPVRLGAMGGLRLAMEVQKKCGRTRPLHLADKATTL